MQPGYASNSQAKLRRTPTIKLNLESTLYKPSPLLHTSLADYYIKKQVYLTGV